MGVGSRVITSPIMLAHSTPGHFWMPLLEGPHVSTDCAIVKGEVKWLRHATGVPGPEGTFKYWTLHPMKCRSSQPISRRGSASTWPPTPA